MSQEYTEDKVVTFNKLSRRCRLLEALLILIFLSAIWLMVALLSFNPSDPSWSQTAWHEPINNLGGVPGAWLADTLFFIFGIIAYTIPIIIIGVCWFVWRHRATGDYIDYFAVSLRLIGVLALILTSCGLAAINADDIWYFASGGVIGSLFSTTLQPLLRSSGGTLALLCIWAAGLTLFTGWSWVTIAEKIGSVILNILTFASNRTRRDDTWVDDKEYEEEDEDKIAYSARGVPAQADDVFFSGHRATEVEQEYDPLLNGRSVTEPVVAAAAQSFAAPTEPVMKTPQPAAEWQYAQQPAASAPSMHSEPQAAYRSPAAAVTAAQEEVYWQPQSVAQPWQLEPQIAPAPEPVVESEPVVEETKHSRPPFYYFDKVEEKRASERKQVAAWYQLIPEPAHPEPVAQPSAPSIPTPPAAQVASTTGHAVAASAPRPQVKEGIGPQLPRPNRVRVPTRRELASYGIKLPSQRMAEESAREDEVRQPNPHLFDDDADMLQQNELAHQFAASQQQRYSGEQQAGAQAFAPEDFNFSPIKTLVDERQSVPLFTPIVMPEPQASAEPPQYQQPSQQPQESLIHPLLMRNGDSRPVQKPTTPLPSLDLLTHPPAEVEPVDTFALEQMARLVEARLADFRIKADVVNYSPGPVITRFELNLAPGVKAARISNLSRDLARSLSTVVVRVVEVIPGKPYVGLELPNKKRQTVYLREVLDCVKFRESQSPLTVVLGKDIAGDPVIADLAKMPHLLVAGTTGSGKSVGVNAMILSMLYKATPEDVRFIMIDPKMLELSVYGGIPHLLTKVVTDMKDAANALRWSVNEMERRYKLMSALGVRNLAGYNEKIAEAARMGRPIPDPYWKLGDSISTEHPVLEKLPYIVVMVDEFADLMMTVGKKVEELIARLAQKARAAGIHLVLATQRPSVDVITGLIKANIPTRIAFTVSSKIDSRTILDQSGAESLLGMGDMLYSGPNSTSSPVRVHGAFVRDQEVHAVVQDWKARDRPQYVDGITSDSESGCGGFDGGEELDPLFDQAVNFVTEKRKASISGVQRQFRIGYNRAARIIEQMEAHGIVSEQRHNGNREVLAPSPFE